MNALDSPLDASALDYLSFGSVLAAINSIRARVAFLTAAVSFWRIRAVGTKSDIPDELSRTVHHDGEEENVSVSELDLTSSSLGTSTRAPSGGAVDTNERASPKLGEKITVYYEDDSDDGEVDEDDGRDGGFWVVGGRDDYWSDNWEKVMRMRIGDGVEMAGAWYRYEDLTVFDGNVVRLWDGC